MIKGSKIVVKNGKMSWRAGKVLRIYHYHYYIVFKNGGQAKIKKELVQEIPNLVYKLL